MSKVLITGANGFIGRQLCLKLSFTGRTIIKLVRRINEDDKSDQFLCDLGLDQINDNMFDGVETVFHLAGIPHDTNNKAIKDSLYYDVNVIATEQLAIAAEKKGVKKFIYISSVKAGGTPLLGKCMSEDDQTEPDEIYGKTKRDAELRLLEIQNKSEIQISIIRPSLVYGPDVKGNLHKMRLAIKKGWFPPLPETGNRRSMIHVDDLVDILLLVESDKRSNGEIFIATDGNNYSSNQIYRAISKSLGLSVKKWVVPNICFILLARIGDLVNPVFQFPFDSFRYQKLLGDECFSSEKIQNILNFKASNNFFSNNKSSQK
jgi:UDP-glucose 4-epimerase